MQKIGNCEIFENPDDLVNNVKRYKIVFDSNNVIYAVSVYKHKIKNSGYKCSLIGANIDCNRDDSRFAVKTIVKSDIVNFKRLYWVEASGAISHWYEKYGAVKIPAVYAADILKKDIILDDTNEYKYSREIYGLNEPVTKTIYGFDSQSTLEKILSGEKCELYEQQLIDAFKEEYYILQEDYSKKRIDRKEYKVIFKIANYIIDMQKKYNAYCNVTEHCHSVLYYIYKKCEYILRYNRSLLSNDERKEFLLIYTEVKKICLKSNILKLQQYF